MSRAEKVTMLRTWLEDGGYLRAEERAVLVEQFGEGAQVGEAGGQRRVAGGEMGADGAGDETK
eukprot:8763474-Prorocentrum_lima.AAC.1